MKAAATYHNQQLLIKYGIIPFASMILDLRYKERQAVLHYRKGLKLRAINALKTYLESQKQQAMQQEHLQSLTAYKFRQRRLKRAVIYSL